MADPIIQEPAPQIQLAAQLKQQQDAALNQPGANDDLARLEAEFNKAGIVNTPTIPTPTVPTPTASSPTAPAAPAPAAGAKEPAKPADAPKSRIPASLLTKKPAAAPALDPNKAGTEAIDDALAKILDGIDSKGAEDRIKELASVVKEAKRRIKEDYEPARDTSKAKIKELETEIATLKESPKAHQTRFEALQKERDELDAALKKVSIENHPQFKAAFDDKIASIIEKAKGLVGEENATLLDNIFAAGPNSKAAQEAYDQLVDSIGSFKANALMQSKLRLDELKSERSSELENWKKNSSSIEQVERSKAVEAEKARVAERDLSIRKTLADITSDQSDLYVFRKVEGDETWNAGVEKRLAEFQQFATQELTPAAQVELAKRAASAAGAFDLIAQITEDYKAIAAELEAIKKATPGFGGSGSSSGGGAEPKDESYGDRVTRLVGQAGLFK